MRFESVLQLVILYHMLISYGCFFFFFPLQHSISYILRIELEVSGGRINGILLITDPLR